MISIMDANIKHSYTFQSNGVIIIPGKSLDEIIGVIHKMNAQKCL